MSPLNKNRYEFHLSQANTEVSDANPLSKNNSIHFETKRKPNFNKSKKTNTTNLNKTEKSWKDYSSDLKGKPLINKIANNYFKNYPLQFNNGVQFKTINIPTSFINNSSLNHSNNSYISNFNPVKIIRTKPNKLNDKIIKKRFIWIDYFEENKKTKLISKNIEIDKKTANMKKWTDHTSKNKFQNYNNNVSLDSKLSQNNKSNDEINKQNEIINIPDNHSYTYYDNYNDAISDVDKLLDGKNPEPFNLFDEELL